MRDALAIVGIEELLAEPLRRIDPVVIDLLERRLAVAAVMFVRRIAAPVAGRIDGLADHQPADVRVVDENIVDLPRVDAAAAVVHLHLVRLDENRRTPFGRRRREDDGFERVLGLHDELGAARQVQRRRTFVEYALTADGPLLAGSAERPAALLKHDDRFFVVGLERAGRSGLETQPARRQFACARLTAMLERLKTGGARLAEECVCKHDCTCWYSEIIT